MFTLLHPTNGVLASAQLALEGEPNLDSDNIPEIQLGTYVNTQVRRQLLNSMLFVLREYSHCSIANQLCIIVLDNLKSLFDVIDIVTMQKFVINEFS
jgi:hypothetical protein